MTRQWIVAAALIAFGLTGCVSQDQYDRAITQNHRLEEQIVSANERNEELEGRLKAQQEALKTEQGELRNKLADTISERDKLRIGVARAEAQIRQMGGTTGPLGPELDAELTRLAASNPDLLTYDSKKGMVKLSSDLTFDSGSATVSPNAETALSKLAAILKSSAAAPYEALIVGHTDSQRISRPNTRAQHPTNWHLSVHRAIAVKDALDGAGVPPTRICVAGYGEFRPIVSNGAHGAAQNRRVEIFLVRSTAGPIEPGPAIDSSPAGPAPVTPPSSAVPQHQEDPALSK